MRFISGLGMFFCVVFSQYSFAASDDICEKYNCKVIIDAGSSGTRVHLYAYDNLLQPNNIQEIYAKKITPGFSTLNIDAIDSYLDNLMSNIPETAKPLQTYFYATAGMRLLPLEQQSLMYQGVSKWFSKKSNFSLVDTRTISGTEEGVFGWVAADYQMSNDDFGFIEIGGASTQVVFPIVDKSYAAPEDVIKVNLYGKDIYLFAHSFLGLGINQVMAKFANTESCFPVGYTLTNGYIASGDATHCRQEIFDVINTDNNVTNIVKQSQTNNPTNAWYTTGAASQLSQNSALSLDKNFFTANQLLEASNHFFCKQIWQNQIEQYPSDPYLLKNCMTSALYYSLSVNGYGLDPNQRINNFPEDKEADWSMGALILGSSDN